MHHLAQQFVEGRIERGLVGPGRRVSEDLRDLAVRFARWKFETGGSLEDAATQLSVLPATLERWLDAAPPEPLLRQVVVRDETPLSSPAAKGLVLTTPDGFRIEGFTAPEVADLLRYLR